MTRGVIANCLVGERPRWVCTCPYFVTSRFLVCKHLVQSVGPVPAIFYLQVKRNRTTPFWLHPILQPEGLQMATASGSGGDSPMADDNTNRNARDEDSDDEDDGLIDTEPGLAMEYRKSLRERSCNLKITGCWRHLKGTVPHSCGLLRVV